MSALAKPRRLMWVDLETTGLPVGTDFSDVHLLEIAVIVTDTDLNKLGGYVETIKMTPEAAAALRANAFIKNMHAESGLLRECVKEATVTMEQAEQEIMDLLQAHGEPQEYAIAGSGVAAFDHPFIKSKMPFLDTWLVYYPFDIGIMRRVSKILTGISIVSATALSYGDAKIHRALADVEAHLEEASKYREVLRAAFVIEGETTAHDLDLEAPL